MSTRTKDQRFYLVYYQRFTAIDFVFYKNSSLARVSASCARNTVSNWTTLIANFNERNRQAIFSLSLSFFLSYLIFLNQVYHNYLLSYKRE